MSYRRNYRKKTYRKKTNSNYALTKKVNYLSSVVNSELKYHESVYVYSIDGAGTILPFNNIVQGDSQVNRTGNTVLPKWLTLHMALRHNDATTEESEVIRIIVFRYWGEGTDAAPNVTVGDILDIANPLSFLNDNNTGSRGDRERRIQIHKSYLLALNKSDKALRTFKLNIAVNKPSNKRKEHMKFRSSATEDAISGGFYVLVIGENLVGAVEKNSIDVRGKLNFYDN